MTEWADTDFDSPPLRPSSVPPLQPVSPSSPPDSPVLPPDPPRRRRAPMWPRRPASPPPLQLPAAAPEEHKRGDWVESVRAMFLKACAAGDQARAAELADDFGLSADDARANGNAALHAACWNGHLGLARWLVTSFRLDMVDARACDDGALRAACTNGHLAVAIWLADYFRLPRSAGRRAAAAAAAATGGHLSVIAWLADRFDLTTGADQLVCMACKCGHLAVAQWAAGQCGRLELLNAVRANDNEVLRMACAFGFPLVVKWLVRKIGLTAADAAQAMNAQGRYKVLAPPHAEAISWLVAEFGLEKMAVAQLAAAQLRRAARRPPHFRSGDTPDDAELQRLRFCQPQKQWCSVVSRHSRCFLAHRPGHRARVRRRVRRAGWRSESRGEATAFRRRCLQPSRSRICRRTGRQ